MVLINGEVIKFDKYYMWRGRNRWDKEMKSKEYFDCDPFIDV